MKLDQRIDTFEVIVITLTFYILFSLTWQVLGEVTPEVRKLLIFFDEVACVFFLIDWIGRFREYPNKKSFAIKNLPDLIASLPLMSLFGYIGYIKAIRLIRIFQIIKIFGGVNRIIFYYKTNKFDALKLIFSMTFVLIIVVAPILILQIEQNTGNIKTAEDALWWTYCTLTTIGYGDFYPVTTLGRMLAVSISVGGISLFGLLSSIIITYFQKHEENRD